MHDFIDTLINGPARYTQEQDLSPLWALAVVLGALFIEVIAAFLLLLAIFKIIQNFRSILGWILRKCGVGEKDVPYVFLELTFPASTTKSAFATEQLHILLRGQAYYVHFWDKWAARKLLHSLELVSTKDKGIRYIIRVPEVDAEHIRRNLLSYLPGLKVKQIEDYLAAIHKTSVGAVELQLSGDFALPLQDHKALAEHDPIAYLTGHMTKLAPDEVVAFQIVTAPVYKVTHPRILRRMRQLQHRIALNKELSTKLKVQRSIPGQIFHIISRPFVWLFIVQLSLLSAILTTIFSDSSSNRDPEKRSAGNPYEMELGSTIKAKLDQHLFEVSIRLLVATPDKDALKQRLYALTSSFQPFASSNQSIQVRRHLPQFFPAERLLPLFRERELSPHFLSQPTILSSTELSDLYHFPNTDLTKTEGLVKSHSRDLPSPLSIKRSNAELDVIVGVNEFGGETQEIGMTLAQRQKHTYIIGKTGTGKTTMLMSSIYQDMVNGKGVAVFDPHGDMFRELLSIVPEHRRKDVVVFDPSDRNYPVGLNILDPGIDFEDEDDKQEWITSSVLSVFAKLANEKQWGPRMEHILRNTTLTALQTPNPSLYTLQKLLTDKKYQKEVAKNLKDPVLKQFWEKEFKMMGSMQMSAATAPLTHRLGHFITAKMSRHILLQEKSTIRIADIMNEGNILLVNLSKGDIGEDQSFFFGTILTSFIWMAAYQRTKIPEKMRRDFFVYVDEFQNFATPQFGAITSEGRKFRISLIVSHQNIAQIEDKDLVKVVAGNAATIICLKANPEDETFILPFMKPEVEKGDIVNLAPYHFYMKVATEDSEEAFSGETVPLDVEESERVQKAVVANSRKKYATPKARVEELMETLLNVDAQKSQKKVITTKKQSRPKTATKLHGL